MCDIHSGVYFVIILSIRFTLSFWNMLHITMLCYRGNEDPHSILSRETKDFSPAQLQILFKTIQYFLEHGPNVIHGP